MVSQKTSKYLATIILEKKTTKNQQNKRIIIEISKRLVLKHKCNKTVFQPLYY